MRAYKIVATVVAVPMLLFGMGGVAVADDISNNIDLTIDAGAEVMPLNVGGSTGTTTLYVDPTGTKKDPADGKSGCNFQGNVTTLRLSLISSDPSVATVRPSTVNFTSCDDTHLLTITPLATGTATISASETFNDTTYTFNLAPVTFDVTVTGSSNTAPTVSAGGVTEGASYDMGTVLSPTCNVIDPEDGNSSFAADLSAITGDYASDGIGSQTASCSYTDAGGLTASSSVIYSIIDPSAPVISYILAPATADPGSNGWYTSDVSLAWTVSEPESLNSLVKTGCENQNITIDQLENTYSCSATSAGGSAAQQDVTIKRDATAPLVSYTSANGTVGLNSWYTSVVTATFTGTDVTSGPVTATQTATSSGEGETVTIDSPAFTDNAGNTTPAGTASQSFKIDLSKPTNVAFVGGPADTASYYYGSVPLAPTCTADDAVSGLASCQVSGYSSLVGPHTLTATAIDNAGWTDTATTRSYSVLKWTLNGFYQPVDKGGVLNTVKGGSTVPLKFEVFAGATELTSTLVVESFKTKIVNCASGSGAEDAIELVTTGGTSLRYDTTGGQFIQNWKTPTGAGSCYSATMTTIDGSSITALFKIK